MKAKGSSACEGHTAAPAEGAPRPTADWSGSPAYLRSTCSCGATLTGGKHRRHQRRPPCGHVQLHETQIASCSCRPHAFLHPVTSASEAIASDPVRGRASEYFLFMRYCKTEGPEGPKGYNILHCPSKNEPVENKKYFRLYILNRSMIPGSLIQPQQTRPSLRSDPFGDCLSCGRLH